MSVLKVGSSGSDVKRMQKQLNERLKPSPKLEVDGKFGPATDAAVRDFQKKQKLKVDGKVGRDTDDVLFVALKPKLKDPPEFFVTHKGKTVAFTKKEYQQAVDRLLAEIRRGPVLQIKIRVEEARSLWNHFNELNNDQYIVSWLIEATRSANLPSQSLIHEADKAQQSVESALNSKNIKALKNALEASEPTINKTLDVMRKYRMTMIKGGENWVSNLNITKTTAFTAVSIMAAPVAASAGASTLAAGVISGSGPALVESMSNEIGRATAGTKSQTLGGASWNIVRDSILGGAMGAVCKGKLGQKITDGVSKHVAKKIAGGVLTEKAAAKAVGKYLKGSFEKTLEGAVEDAVKAMKNEKMNRDMFFENVAKNILAGGALGELEKILDNAAPSITRKLQRSTKFKDVYKKISTAGRKELTDKQVETLVADAIKGPLSKSFQDATSKAVDKMGGKESQKELREKMAENFLSDKKVIEKLEAYAKKKSGR